MAKDSGGVPSEAKIDPRIRDVVKFNRIRDLVEREILHQAWGCALWSLERQEKITREQRMAGDSYINLCENYNYIMQNEEPPSNPDDRKKWEEWVARVKRRYAECQDLLARGDIRIRRAIDELCFFDLIPICEVDLKRVDDGLTRLEVFFNPGMNRS